MRSLLAVTLTALFLLLTAQARAAERDAALAIIGEAIKAHGGADALARAQQMTRTATGVMTSAGKDVPFTDELLLALPDRYRQTVDLGAMGQPRARIIVVLAKEKGWQQAGGMTTELGNERLEELRGDVFLIWLETLTPLPKDDSLTLAPGPDEKVNGTPAAVVKLGRKGQPDAKLFFDKSSNLLIKVERKAHESGTDFLQEFFFSDHKAFDGAKLPTKIVEMRSGRKFIELSEIKYKFLNHVDDATFGKP